MFVRDRAEHLEGNISVSSSCKYTAVSGNGPKRSFVCLGCNFFGGNIGENYEPVHYIMTAMAKRH